jgi:hypothetical protein
VIRRIGEFIVAIEIKTNLVLILLEETSKVYGIVIFSTCQLLEKNHGLFCAQKGVFLSLLWEEKVNKVGNICVVVSLAEIF